MSTTPDPRDQISASAADAAQRARIGMRRDALRLSGTIADFFLPDDARLDDRTRLTLATVLGAIVGAIEGDIRRHAARVLGNWAEDGAAAALIAAQGRALDRLLASQVLRDRSLMEELIGRVRQDLLAELLPTAVSEPDEPSVVVRLTDVGDGVVASAAGALLAAQSRRRTANDLGMAAGSELTADNHHRLVWWTAAAVREGAGDNALVDRAIEEAALRSLAAHDEGERLESLAVRLAIAIDARPSEVPTLLVDILGDRALALFIAVLARAIGLDYAQMRRIVLDADGSQLWLALRAVQLDRAAIARIGLSLADADPTRDVEAFADRLDEIAAIAPEVAQAALAPFATHPDLRRALADLAEAPFA
ncbi:hypothetical protein ACT009_01175 [Sphingomonas sp. Tas61C01]|uniref:hypothetical protein n=1 Tax=Sphingomonas sp. Tas61C01 TaxID=3458297 RepID=UPI00403EDBD1